MQRHRKILTAIAATTMVVAAVGIGHAALGDNPSGIATPGIEKLTQGFPGVGATSLPPASVLESADVGSVRFQLVHDTDTPGVICLVTGPDLITASNSCGPAASLRRDGVVITRATSAGGPMTVFGMAPETAVGVAMTNTLAPVSGTHFFVAKVDRVKGTTVTFSDSTGGESAVALPGHG